MLDEKLKSQAEKEIQSDAQKEHAAEPALDAVQEQEAGQEEQSANAVKAEVQKAVAAQDGNQLSTLLNGLTDAARTAIASDTGLMKQIMSLDSATSHPALDKLYTGVQDTDLLRDIIFSRFKVIVGGDRITNGADKKTYETFLDMILKSYKQYIPSGAKDISEVEKPFTLNGLVELYRMYTHIPQSMLDEIKCVFTTATNFSTAGLSWCGFYLFTYDDRAMSETHQFYEQYAKKGSFTSDASDGRVGENKFDFTSTHELGHVVDHTGTKYSNKADFYALSGWKQLDRSKPDKIIAEMRQSFEDESHADPEGYDSEQAKEIVDRVGVNMLQSYAYNDATRDLTIDKTLDQRKVKKLIKKSGKTREEFAASLKNAPLLQHVQRSLYSNTPWFNGEAFDGMKRQVHQDYSGAWYSYDSASQKDGKISTYQFCNPAEEFAEIFAAYYVSTSRSGENITNKAWFKKYQEWLEKTVIRKDAAAE